MTTYITAYSMREGLKAYPLIGEPEGILDKAMPDWDEWVLQEAASPDEAIKQHDARFKAWKERA